MGFRQAQDALTYATLIGDHDQEEPSFSKPTHGLDAGFKNFDFFA